jgi:hypothetical protein
MIGDPLLRGSFFICGNARKKTGWDRELVTKIVSEFYT